MAIFTVGFLKQDVRFRPFLPRFYTALFPLGRLLPPTHTRQRDVVAATAGLSVPLQRTLVGARQVRERRANHSAERSEAGGGLTALMTPSIPIASPPA